MRLGPAYTIADLQAIAARRVARHCRQPDGRMFGPPVTFAGIE
jgi:hypothetical protein